MAVSRDAWEALADRRGLVPWVSARREVSAGAGWRIVAEEIPMADGSVPFDVYAIYTCPVGGRVGERIPAGPNLHGCPVQEIDRLLRVVA